MEVFIPPQINHSWATRAAPTPRGHLHHPIVPAVPNTTKVQLSTYNPPPSYVQSTSLSNQRYPNSSTITLSPTPTPAVPTRSHIRLKFDSCASHSLSNIPDHPQHPPRLEDIKPVYNTMVSGFNGSKSPIHVMGTNPDGIPEFHCDAIAPNTGLLCANHYARDGAVVLYDTYGAVYKFTPHQLDHFKELLHDLGVTPSMHLTVSNSSYVVESADIESCSYPILSFTVDEGLADSPSSTHLFDIFVSNVSTRFFPNTKIHVNGKPELVLVHRLMGFPGYRPNADYGISNK